MARRRWFRGNGSTGLIQVRNITRLFVVSEYNGTAEIKANVGGSAICFLIEKYDSVADAEIALSRMYAELNPVKKKKKSARSSEDL